MRRHRCVCGRWAYGRRVHDCCAVYGPDCPACAASDEAERRWHHGGKQWAEKVKAHWQAESDRLNATQED